MSNLSELLATELWANGVDFAHAASFTTGPGAYQLDSVTVSVFTGSPGGGTSELRLRTDAGGAPGALIESLGSQTMSSQQGQVLRTYGPAGTALAANTTYWVTLGETGSGDFRWGGTISPNQSSPSSWTIGDLAWRRAAGSSIWLPVSFGPNNATAVFEVDANETPPISWVVVGNPGNGCDTQAQGCFGAVAYSYLISKYEVTNAQFAEFLNAIGASDPNGIFKTDTAITQSGSSGSFTYGVPTGANHPMTGLSFYDALRFANWLHNDRPSGAQDATTTEDGAYTFSGPTTAGPRNPGARYALPAEDEWYKAAYYNPTSASYFDWPTSTDGVPTCSMPTATPNHANCETPVLDFTDVGSYTGSPSPYGTFDQGGNAWEWNETLIGSERGIRGGSWHPIQPRIVMAAATRPNAIPTGDGPIGFRVVPEPGTSLQLTFGIIALLGLARRRARSGNRSAAGSPKVLLPRASVA